MASPIERAEVAEVGARRAAVPAVVVPDRHVRVRVDVRAGVRGAHHQLAHVAQAGVVGRAPRLVAGRADPLRRAVGQRPRTSGGRGTAASSGSARGRAGTSRSRSPRSGRRGRCAQRGCPDERCRGRSRRSSRQRGRVEQRAQGAAARARGAGRDCHAIDRVAHLGRGALARRPAALAPSRRRAAPWSPGTRASRRPAAGRPRASRRPRARGSAAATVRELASGAPARAASARRSSAQRSWCQRLYSGESQSRAESHAASGSGTRARCRAARRPGAAASPASGSSSSSQSSVRSRWRACGCTSRSTRAHRAVAHAQLRHVASELEASARPVVRSCGDRPRLQHEDLAALRPPTRCPAAPPSRCSRSSPISRQPAQRGRRRPSARRPRPSSSSRSSAPPASALDDLVRLRVRPAPCGSLRRA